MGKLFRVAFLLGLLSVSIPLLSEQIERRNESRPMIRSPYELAAVRDWYAAVGTWMVTGEWQSIAAPSLGLDATWYLSALRDSYPRAEIELLSVEASGATLSALVSIDPGHAAHELFSAAEFPQPWIAAETFDVESGRIVDYSIDGPIPPLMISHPQVAITSPHTDGRLLIGRLTFSPGSDAYVSIPGPAIVSVESGVVDVLGDGVSVLSRAGADAIGTSPGAKIPLRPGEAVQVQQSRVVISHVRDELATVLVATFASPSMQLATHENRHPAYATVHEALSREGSVAVGAGVTAETVSSIALSGDTGGLRLQAGWIVLAPGSQGRIESGVSELVLVQSAGTVRLNSTQGHGVVVSNADSGLSIAWVAFVSI